MKYFLFFLFVHLVVDYVLQNGFVFQLKRKHIWGIWLHSGMQLVVVAFFLPFLLPGHFGYLLGSAVFLVVVHAVIDRGRQVITDCDPKQDTLFLFLIDQLIHIGTIALIAFFAPSGEIFRFGSSWLIPNNIFLMVTLFSTVLVFYCYGAFFRQFIPEVFSLRSRIYTILSGTIFFLLYYHPFLSFFPYLLLVLLFLHPVFNPKEGEMKGFFRLSLQGCLALVLIWLGKWVSGQV